MLATDYRRGVSDGGSRMFASRGISLPSIWSIALVVIVAFAAGIGVGWGTGLVADQLAAPGPSTSPSPSASPTPEIEVSLPPLATLDRELDEADALVGLNSLDVVRDGSRSFATVTADGEPSGGSASVRWVRVEYEEGLDLTGKAFGDFVLDTLNDPRGWGARGRFEFVPTGGAPDIRIVLASPGTALAACPNPHATAPAGALVDPSATPEPAVDTSTAAEEDTSCAEQGVVMINHYDWMVGFAAYGDDRTAARQYMVNHAVGHVLSAPDEECSSGRAEVMADHNPLAEGCEANPWPWPDEPIVEPAETARPEDE